MSYKENFSSEKPLVEESITTSEPIEVESFISSYMKSLAETVIEKNRVYGNNLHNPIGVFYKGDDAQGIMCRIDDKLNRIKAVGINNDTEDTIDDLVGYLVHLKYNIQKNKTKKYA